MNWGLGVRRPWWDLTTCLHWSQAFLCFRPHEWSLDIPGGPAEQYCNLARDLQLEAFLQFVSGISIPPPPLLLSFDKQVVAPTRVIFRS